MLRRSVGHTLTEKFCAQVMGTTNGADVQLRPCDGGQDQDWEQLDYNSGYQFKNRKSGKCIDNRGGYKSKTQVGTWACLSDGHGAKANQTWTVSSAGKISSANGYWYFTADSVNGNQNSTQADRWTIS